MPMEIKPKRSSQWLTPDDKVVLVITSAIACGLVAGLWLAFQFWG